MSKEFDVEPNGWRDRISSADREAMQAHLMAFAKLAGIELDNRDYIGYFQYVPDSIEGRENLTIRWERKETMSGRMAK